MLNSGLADKNSAQEGEPLTGAPCPCVSVVVPVRNEEEVLERCLRSLLKQSYPPEKLEILVVDGRSSDGSRIIVHKLAKEFSNLRLYDNAQVSTPAGMNVGVRAAKGSIIVIAGAHAVYPQTYIENCVAYLAQTGADVVGGPVRTESIADGLGAQVACAILSNGFGVGNSRFRIGGAEGLVDTVPFGAYRKEVFDQVGLFNEALDRNQDNDLSARVRKAGGTIYFTPVLTAVYFTAAGYTDLLRRTFKKTQWHMRTLRENSRALGFRHFAPAAFLIALTTLGILSPSHLFVRIALAFILALYLAIGCLFSIRSSERRTNLVAAILPFACLPFHVAYGLGTILGLRHLIFAHKQQFRSSVPPVQDRLEADTEYDLRTTGGSKHSAIPEWESHDA